MTLVCIGSRLCENSDVELERRKFVSITLNKKRTALAVTIERRKERKQFCAFSARARFHTAWAQSGHADRRIECPLLGEQRKCRTPCFMSTRPSERVENAGCICSQALRIHDCPE